MDDIVTTDRSIETPSLSPRKLGVLAILALIGLTLAVRVPYFFPPAVRTLSASYDYGFNNSVGILILGLFGLVFAALGFSWLRSEFTIEFGPRELGSADIPVRDIAWAGGLSLVVVAALFGLSGSFGFGESTQFLLAMERIAAGQRLYLDFEFYYGPLLAYGPYAIHKVVQSGAADFRSGYFLALAVLQLIGLFELRYILNALALDVRSKRRMFYALALATLPFHSGINLILFRFITPAAGLIFLGRSQMRAMLARVSAIFGLTFLTFGISVEYGVVFSVATLVYFSCAVVFDRVAPRLVDVLATLIAPVLFYLLFPGLFHTVDLYLQGAWRWPFVPSLAVFLFLSAVLVLALTIGAKLRDIRGNYFFLSFCLLALGSLPAALGRCDPGHLVLNGMLILVLAGAGVGAARVPRIARACGLAFILTFGLLYNYSTLRAYGGLYASQAFRKLSEAIPAQKMAGLVDVGARLSGMKRDEIAGKIERFNASKAIDYTQAFRNIGRIAAPYQPREDLATYLRDAGKLEFLYFKDYSILASDLEVARALSDLRQKNPEFLLLPETWAETANAQDDGPLINLVFTTRYTRKPIRNSRALLEPVVAYVQANYSPQDQVGTFVILKRRASQ